MRNISPYQIYNPLNAGLYEDGQGDLVNNPAPDYNFYGTDLYGLGAMMPRVPTLFGAMTGQPSQMGPLFPQMPSTGGWNNAGSSNASGFNMNVPIEPLPSPPPGIDRFRQMFPQFGVNSGWQGQPSNIPANLFARNNPASQALTTMSPMRPDPQASLAMQSYGSQSYGNLNPPQTASQKVNAAIESIKNKAAADPAAAAGATKSPESSGEYGPVLQKYFSDMQSRARKGMEERIAATGSMMPVQSKEQQFADYVSKLASQGWSVLTADDTYDAETGQPDTRQGRLRTAISGRESILANMAKNLDTYNRTPGKMDEIPWEVRQAISNGTYQRTQRGIESDLNRAKERLAKERPEIYVGNLRRKDIRYIP